jgi:molybdate transport system substrate-binding protein
LSGVANAAEIKVLSTQATEQTYRELVPQFEQASGHKVMTIFTGTLDANKRLAAGETYDLLIMSSASIDEHIKGGKVVPGSRVDLAKSGVAVAVRAGAPKPDISTVEAYRATLLAAKSIGYSRGCSGQHVAEGIAQLGLTEKLKPKVVLTGGGTGPVTFFLARGDFELGIQQTNIMVGAPGTDYVGPVPGFLNKPCPNSVALLSVSKEQDAARAMIRFMVSPQAAPLLRKVHEEPAKS